VIAVFGFLKKLNRELSPWQQAVRGTLFAVVAGMLCIGWAAFNVSRDASLREATTWKLPENMPEKLSLSMVEVRSIKRKVGNEVQYEYRMRKGNEFSSLGRPVQAALSAHIDRFNSVVKDHKAAKVGLEDALAEMKDSLFVVTVNPKTGKITTRLNDDRRKWDRSPPSSRKLALMAPLYGSLRLDPKYRLCGRDQNLFVVEGGGKAAIDFDAKGHAAAESVTVRGQKDQLWTFRLDKGALLLSGSCVNLNGKPMRGNNITLHPGDIVALENKVFNVQRGGSQVELSFSKQIGRGAVRSYPFGRAFSFIGPTGKGLRGAVGGEALLGPVALFAEGEKRHSLALSFEPFLQRKWSEKIQGLGTENMQGRRTDDKFTPSWASFCLMNANTGEVLVLAQNNPGREWDPNDPVELVGQSKRFNTFRHRGMRSHIWGSAVKPIIAFAALNSYPYLVDLKLADSGAVSRVFGADLNVQLSAHYTKEQNFDEYVQHSNNVYHMALGMAALMECETRSDFDKLLKSVDPKSSVGNVCRVNKESWKKLTSGFVVKGSVGQFGKSRLVQTMNALFSLESEKRFADYGPWRPHDWTGTWPPRNAWGADVATLSMENYRPEEATADGARAFTNFMLGAQRNQWNDVKICEAYSRMITGRFTEATFLRRRNGYVASPMGARLQDAPYTRKSHVWLQDAMRLVTVGKGTAADTVGKAFRKASKPKNLEIYSKTGTIKAWGDRRESSSYGFVLGVPDGDGDFQGDVYTGYLFLKSAKDSKALKKFVSKNLEELIDDLYGNPAVGTKKKSYNNWL